MQISVSVPASVLTGRYVTTHGSAGGIVCCLEEGMYCALGKILGMDVTSGSR